MKLQKKGLLSDCEHLLTPLTTDQEGNLRGGFGDFGGVAVIPTASTLQNLVKNPILQKNQQLRLLQS